MLASAERARLRVKDLEFRLPLACERLALSLHSGLSSGPWTAAERELNVIFTHVPKAAGTSVARTPFDRKSRHVPIIRHAAYDWSLFCQAFKFTFVRNPWSRVHSAYHYLKCAVGKDNRSIDHRWAAHYLSETLTFEDFILRLKNRRYCSAVKRYTHFRNQVDWISVPRRGVVMDFIGRFEYLETDVLKLSKNLASLDVSNLEHMRQGTGRDYRDEYTSEMVSIVGDLYEKDAVFLNYEFE